MLATQRREIAGICAHTRGPTIELRPELCNKQSQISGGHNAICTLGQQPTVCTGLCPFSGSTASASASASPIITHARTRCGCACWPVPACVIHLNMRICTDASHGLYTRTHGCAIVRVCIKVRACFSGKSPFPMILFGMCERVCECVCMCVLDAHARLTPSPNSSCIRDYGIRVCVCACSIHTHTLTCSQIGLSAPMT